MDVLQKLRANGIDFDRDELSAVAREFEIVELAVFGSSIRQSGERPKDIDLLVSFAPDAQVSLFDLIDLEKRLESLFHLPVDLVEPQAITNPIRRKNILATVETLYAA